MGLLGRESKYEEEFRLGGERKRDPRETPGARKLDTNKAGK